MFYSQFILAKKGPLGTIWIAAHLERKLRKNQVAETDIGVTVDSILFPDVPIALRLSGHLLLGVVRVYSRQVNYLFNDCSETLVKIKQAFHSTAVDLPPEATTAPFHSITLPETFDFDELELLQDSESTFLRGPNGNYVDHHVTSREQITLQDSIENNPYLGSSQFGLDERFGDGNFSAMAMDFDEEFLAEKSQTATASTSTPLLKEETFPPLNDGIDEATQMDIDDPYATTGPQYQNKKIATAYEDAAMLRIDQNEEDNHQGLSMLTAFPEPLEDQITSIASPLMIEPMKDGTTSILSPSIGAARTPATIETVSNMVAYKNDRPNIHAFTPYVEAYTPDLNIEFCPPDEPSTPALLDEASFSMCKESSIETQRKSPLGLQESAASNSGERQAGVLSTNQGFFNIPSEQQKQQTSSVQSQCLPPFMEPVSPVSTPALDLQSENCVASSIMNGEKLSIPSHHIQTPSLAVSSTEATEGTTSVYEGFTFSHSSAPGVQTDALVGRFPNPKDGINQDCSIIGSVESISSFQLTGCSALSAAPLNTELDFSNTKQEIAPCLEVCGTTVSSGNTELALQSKFQNLVGSDQQSKEQDDTTSQASTLRLPSIQDDTGSVSIMPEVTQFEQTMTENLETQATPEAQDGDAAVQQPDVLPETSTSLPMHIGEIPQCETLRAVIDSPRETSGLMLLEKNILDERIPTLESARAKAGIESYTASVEPVFDETPILKEWNPHTVQKPSPLSTGDFNFLPGDNDVLASILGRRKSSAFKVAPTPKENVIVKKRKVAPRSIPKKRKCDFDSSAVLHGDIIRQQLAYTEDIRRERCKAPCTRREVWSFNKEVEGQQHFDMPLLLGFPSDLHDLYHDVLDAPESRNMSSDKDLEEGTPAMTLIDTNSKAESSFGNKNEPSKDGPVILQNIVSDRPEDSALGDFSEQVGGDIEITGNLNEGLVEGEIMKHMDSNIQDNGQEASEKCTVELSSGMHDDSHVQNLENTNRSEAKHLDVLPRPETSEDAAEVTHLEVLEPEASKQAVGVTYTEGLEEPETSEQVVEITHMDVLEGPDASEQAAEITHMEVLEGSEANDQSLGVKYPEVLEVPKSSEQAFENDVINEENNPDKEQSTVIEMENNAGIMDDSGGMDNLLQGDTTLSADENLEHISTQQCTQDADKGEFNIHENELNSQVLRSDLEKDVADLSIVTDREHIDVSETQLEPRNEEDAIQAALEPSDENNDEVSAMMPKDGHTDFLADDDEMAYAEVYEDSGDERDPSILENSGWSVRSRKVGRYLKTMFEGMEDISNKTGQDHRNLGLERLLACKTRREAARMFFETLVLKTKGYIQVKQELAYEDIHLYPSPKLMKTTF